MEQAGGNTIQGEVWTLGLLMSSREAQAHQGSGPFWLLTLLSLLDFEASA